MTGSSEAEQPTHALAVAEELRGSTFGETSEPGTGYCILCDQRGAHSKGCIIERAANALAATLPAPAAHARAVAEKCADYYSMIDELECGAKLFGRCPAGYREKKAAALLRFLGEPQTGIAWNEDKGWHRIGEIK